MARRRFFVPQIRGGTAELTGADAEHLVRVLRGEPGQLYEISDNRNVYLAKVESARKSSVAFQIIEEVPLSPPSVNTVLLAALIKFDRFEWLIEKSTELGVAVIQPTNATRTERGLAEAARKRSIRWDRIAREASEQSRRARLPQIEPVTEFADALKIAASVRLLLDEHRDAPPILQVIPPTRTPADHVALLLGPEGGWTDDERERALNAGWSACSLGGNILRAETAAVAGLAVIQAAWNAR